MNSLDEDSKDEHQEDVDIFNSVRKETTANIRWTPAKQKSDGSKDKTMETVDIFAIGVHPHAGKELNFRGAYFDSGRQCTVIGTKKPLLTVLSHGSTLSRKKSLL